MKRIGIFLWLTLATAVFAQPAVVRNVEYGRIGNQALQLDFYPSAQPQAPLVIYLHGGGWASGSRAKLGLAAQELRQEGFALASVDYRLVPQAVWPSQIQDVKCAVRYLRLHAGELGVDPERFGVWGESAGGHLACLIGLAGPEAGFDNEGGSSEASSKVQAVADLYGPTDFTTNDLTTGRGLAYLSGLVQNRPELYPQASPASYVTNTAPPFLIVHGEGDDLVPIHQSELLAEKLSSAGVSAQLVRVSQAGHSFEQHPDKPKIVKRIVDFFCTQLKSGRE